MFKKCSQCQSVKRFCSFNNNKQCKDGLSSWCRECNNILQKSYKKTKNGVVTKMYCAQRSHSKKRGHQMPTYSKKWFNDWILTNPEFHRLYDIWVLSGYDKMLVPSVDRIDDNIGYTEYNIQLTDWQTNSSKGNKDKRSGKLNTIIPHKTVLQYDKKGNFIAKYHSLSEAKRVTGVAIQSISACCIGKRKSAGKFIWQFEKN